MLRNKKKILIGVVLILLPVVFVLAQVVTLFVSRSENQKIESTRIIPVIANSQKAFQASLSQKGHTRITVLLENYRDTGVQGVEADHGISLYVERGEKSYIFDLGESDITLANAKALGIDITKVNSAFISHGHIDHGGALSTFVEQNSVAPVYLSTHAPDNHYRLLFGFYKLNTSLTKYTPDIFTRNKERFRLIDQDIMIEEDLFVLTKIKGQYKKPAANKGVLMEDNNGNVIADDFLHEVAYVMKDKDGLIVYSGCNHNGLLNTLETVSERFPGVDIKSVLGGFHLMNPVTNKMAETEEDVRKIATELKEKYPFTQIYTGHCTGVEGFKILKSILGKKIEYFTTGSKFYIDIEV